VQVDAVSYDRQLMMALDTTVQTPLALGKYPVLQTKQVNGATEVALMQFWRMLDTHEVIPLVVWSPNPLKQLAQAVFEVKVRQLDADGLIQLVELNRYSPLAQTVQV
jgi:hypothetical protein